MNPPICRNCLLRIARRAAHPTHQTLRQLSSSTSSSPPTKQTDPASLLANPTWSIRSLLSPSLASPSNPETKITPSQLSHLLRLSALPQPTSQAETASMLSTLQSQLLFVREIQTVDTKGIQPLRSIRDESAAGLSEATITLDTLKDALASEEVFGHCRRPRRETTTSEDTQKQLETKEAENWDALGTASEKSWKYFVVRSGKQQQEELE
ncbi:hypothetical protein B0H66DRAFT_536125 [Apodospora peruviana]|uniref:Glutamyl-tRNA amidotransferase complex subunit Gta3 domain-containing protein n=1 Tax=Apodospora peruviana TaxID=516989 RepID=A0AAE0M110_9PEZI|nr:hypothetical protein B0H66DRAFT_536125 [Apodospora peruviana]